MRFPLPRLIRIKELQQNVAPFLLLEWAVVLTAGQRNGINVTIWA